MGCSASPHRQTALTLPAFYPFQYLLDSLQHNPDAGVEVVAENGVVVLRGGTAIHALFSESHGGGGGGSSDDAYFNTPPDEEFFGNSEMVVRLNDLDGRMSRSPTSAPGGAEVIFRDGQVDAIALYDWDGNVIYHIDAPDNAHPYWHYHRMREPGFPRHEPFYHPGVGGKTEGTWDDVVDLMNRIGFEGTDWYSLPD